MVLTVWTDLKKLFGDYHIYLCMIGLGFAYILMYLGTLSSNTYRFGIVASYANISEGSEIMLLAFLLCIVGGSFLYCAEEKHGYLNFEIQRIGVKKYTVGKLLASVIGGFCTLMVANLIYLGGILIHRWLVFGTVSFAGENVEAMIWMWLFSALRCGVLSAIGFLVSTYVPNYYIAMTVPLLMYYAILQVQYWISIFFPMIPSKFFFSKVYMGGYLEGDDLQEFIFALLYTACILVIMFCMAKERIERRLEHA